MAPKKNSKQAADSKDDSKTPAAKKGTPTAKHSPKQPPSPASTASLSGSSMSSVSPVRSGISVPGFVASNALTVSGLAATTVATRQSRPSGATVQRILSQGKASASLPKEGLMESFGIKPASTGAREADKDSKLKCVIIQGENGTGFIVLRCEPNNSAYRNGSWAEKSFFDAVRNKEDFVDLCNIDNDMLQWFNNDQAQKNPKGYAIRLFNIPCAECPSEESAIKLGEFICQNINAMPSNNTTITVDPTNYFWIPTSAHPVWSDVIGSDAALKDLVAKKGTPVHGYYDHNAEAIHSYFRPHTFTLDLARVLYAPPEQVHPDIRARMMQQQPIEQAAIAQDDAMVDDMDHHDSDDDDL